MTTIMPNEVYVVEGGAYIRSRCPRELVTEAMIHARVVAANLDVGNFVKVQCLNHERTAVLHFAEWLVFDRRPEMKRLEVNDRETRTVEQVSFSILQTVAWTATPAAPKTEPADEDAPAARGGKKAAA